MMDTITKMVCDNANVSKEQAHKSIEAVLAYIAFNCANEAYVVNNTIVNSNGISVGGYTDGGSILDSYRLNYGNLETQLKEAEAHKTTLQENK